MKFKNLTFKNLFSNICVLIAIIACGSNALQLRDSGKAVQSANSASVLGEVFLEKEGKEKKKKVTKVKATKKKTVAKTAVKKSRAGEEAKTETKTKTKWQTGTQNSPPVAAFKAPYKNDTLGRSMYRDINNTFVKQDVSVFLPNINKLSVFNTSSNILLT